MKEFEYLDHIGYLFNDINEGYEFFKPQNGFKIIRGPGVNHVQKVRYLFISITGSPKIEILSPLDSTSPICSFLNKIGPSLNHLCYAVDDIEFVINKLVTKLQWLLISSPKEDPAFDNRKVAFLRSPNIGLIELLESGLIDIHQDKSIPKITKIKKNEASTFHQPINQNSQKLINNNMRKLIQDALEEPKEIKDNTKSFSEIEGWDSLAMTIFHANFEEMINKRIEFNTTNDINFYISHLTK